jgi:hypothetical protein
VRGRATAIEQACLGKDERAEAGRGNAPASHRSLPRKLDQAYRWRLVATAENQRVEIRTSNRSVATLIPIEARTAPPVSDSRRTS